MVVAVLCLRLCPMLVVVVAVVCGGGGDLGGWVMVGGSACGSFTSSNL